MNNLSWEKSSGKGLWLCKKDTASATVWTTGTHCNFFLSIKMCYASRKECFGTKVTPPTRENKVTPLLLSVHKSNTHTHTNGYNLFLVPLRILWSLPGFLDLPPLCTHTQTHTPNYIISMPEASFCRARSSNPLPSDQRQSNEVAAALSEITNTLTKVVALLDGVILSLADTPDFLFLWEKSISGSLLLSESSPDDSSASLSHIISSYSADYWLYTSASDSPARMSQLP